MDKDNLVNKARNLGVRASQHTAKVINQVQTENEVNIFFYQSYEAYKCKQVNSLVEVAQICLNVCALYLSLFFVSAESRKGRGKPTVTKVEFFNSIIDVSCMKSNNLGTYSLVRL